MLAILYWGCAGIALYPYIGYPAIVILLARFRAQSEVDSSVLQPISVVLAAFNEEQRIGKRIEELVRLATAVHPQSELIVVSDGSTDKTARIARATSASNVRLIELPVNLGKAQALNTGVAAARYDVVAFADARQFWENDTLPRMLQRFADPEIGAVSGDLKLRTSDNKLASVDFYWRLEKTIRVNESRWDSSIGVTGAVCAVRRSLFKTLPQGTLLDDVYWPMAVVLQGRRVVHEPCAIAYDQLPDEIHGEYRRKLRTLTGNFQLLSLMPSLLLPWKNRVWFQFISHKLLRLVTPWLLLVTWVLSLALASDALYACLFTMQTTLLLLGVLAWNSRFIRQIRPFGIMASVFALNYAAWLAFWIFLSGGASLTWKKVEYRVAKATTES